MSRAEAQAAKEESLNKELAIKKRLQERDELLNKISQLEEAAQRNQHAADLVGNLIEHDHVKIEEDGSVTVNQGN